MMRTRELRRFQTFFHSFFLLNFIFFSFFDFMSNISALPIVENTFTSTTRGHSTFYLSCGPTDSSAPLILFIHGWPEFSFSWRYQLPVFGGLGFRCIAPDLRGFGRSTKYEKHSDYSVENSVNDLIELLDFLSPSKTIVIGHDWGAAVTFELASHYPERISALSASGFPYLPNGESIMNHINRFIYPVEKYPVGQWDYILDHQENFERTKTFMENNISRMFKAMFRNGNPDRIGQPFNEMALIRKAGGWFGGAKEIPDFPLTGCILNESELQNYTDTYTKSGFFGPNSYYLNFPLNREYSLKSKNNGILNCPILFIHGRYDNVCDTLNSTLANPMRHSCLQWNEKILNTGHWMAEEKPNEFNWLILQWLMEYKNLWPNFTLFQPQPPKSNSSASNSNSITPKL